MKVPLHEFEQYFDETILKRGLQYFKKGYVQEPIHLGSGQYEAIVEGTENYTVQIDINDNIVNDCVCNCPYDYGPVCKHIVAVLFYLQKDELKLMVTPTRKKGNSVKKPKRKTTEEQLAELMEKISKEELKQFVAEQCNWSKTFRDTFLTKYAYVINPSSKELYSKQIRHLFKAASNRHGFIDYASVGVVGTQVYAITMQAENMAEAGNHITALHIATAVLEEMVKALQFADDSNGDIGGCISLAMEVLFKMATNHDNGEARKELFNYCITTFQKGLFDGWDWHLDLLELACELVMDETEQAMVNASLDTIEANDSGWDWNHRRAQLVRLSLIQKTEGQEQADRFMEAHISNPDIRKRLVEKSIEKEDFDRAIALCEQGIVQDMNSWPGLANDWRNYLLKIYLKQNNAREVIEYARFLFLDSNLPAQPLFEILKSYVPSSEWDTFLASMIQEMAKKHSWRLDAKMAQIYIWEERWQDLMNMVRKNPSIENLEYYLEFLSKEFPEEIADLYRLAILEYVRTYVGRKHYVQACRHLRKLKKMGAKILADKTVEELRSLYPQRKALLEELTKV